MIVFVFNLPFHSRLGPIANVGSHSWGFPLYHCFTAEIERAKVGVAGERDGDGESLVVEF